MLRSIAFAGSLALVSTAVSAEIIVFENVRVFDGTSPSLSEPVSVLVRDNIIERISAAPHDRSGLEVVVRVQRDMCVRMDAKAVAVAVVRLNIDHLFGHEPFAQARRLIGLKNRNYLQVPLVQPKGFTPARNMLSH